MVLVSTLISAMLCTVKSLLTDSSSPYCEYVIPPGETSLVRVDNMEFRECGKPCGLVKIPRNCSAVGCYCKDGYMLNTTTGKCYKEECIETSPTPPPCLIDVGELHSVHTLHDGMR